MRVSVFMLAFNAELFIEQSLQSIYPIADEIFVVEGAVPQAAFSATSTGHSKDSTLFKLAQFKDPQRKLRVITNRTFWPSKDHMCNAAASLATGDILWQVDSDEVYREEDLEKVVSLFESNPEITVGTFPVLHFWHNFYTVTCGGHWEEPFTRVFRFEKGSSWQSHEPPVLLDPQGISWFQRGVVHHFEDIPIFHYSYVTEQQARWKAQFFANYIPKEQLKSSDEATEVGMTKDWFEKVWKAWEKRPLEVEATYGTTPGGGGRTKLYTGDHPQVMKSHPLWGELSL